MTIASEISSVVYQTDGVSDRFVVPFRFLHADHLRVVESRAGIDTLLSGSGDYSVTGENQASGGQVALNTVPAAGGQIKITRVVPITQETHYPKNDPFPERAHEQALDKLTMIAQQINTEVMRVSDIADHTFYQVVTVSTEPPTGGNDGDIWFQVI